MKARRRLPSDCRPPLHGPVRSVPSNLAPTTQGGTTASAAQGHGVSSAHGPSPPAPTGARRRTATGIAAGSWSREAPARKRPRRMGNPASGVSHTPTSSLTEDTPAISPSIGTGHAVDDVRADAQHGSGALLSRWRTTLRLRRPMLFELSHPRLTATGVTLTIWSISRSGWTTTLVVWRHKSPGCPSLVILTISEITSWIRNGGC